MTWRTDKQSLMQMQNRCVRFASIGAAIRTSLMHVAVKPTDEGPPST